MSDQNSTFQVEDVPLDKAAFLLCLGAKTYKFSNSTYYKFNLHVQQWMLDAEAEAGIVPYKKYMMMRKQLKRKAKEGIFSPS